MAAASKPATKKTGEVKLSPVKTVSECDVTFVNGRTHRVPYFLGDAYRKQLRRRIALEGSEEAGQRASGVLRVKDVRR